MTRQALIVGLCAFMIVACVVMAYASGLKFSVPAPPTVNLVGQVTGIDATAAPKYDGLVCGVHLFEKGNVNIVTKNSHIESALMMAFTTQKSVLVVASKLSGAPAGAVGWSGDWYAVQRVSTTAAQ